MFIAYVIKNIKGKRYTGSTNNFEERLKIHNSLNKDKAKFHRTTYKKGPWFLYFKKEFKTRREALSFERFLKTGNGREWLNERARLGE
jgi:putative endonuclease